MEGTICPRPSSSLSPPWPLFPGVHAMRQKLAPPGQVGAQEAAGHWRLRNLLIGSGCHS